MPRRNMKWNLTYASAIMNRWHSILQFMKSKESGKLICYFNTRHSAISFKETLNALLDCHGVCADTILLHGKLPRRIKGYRICLFTGHIASKHLTDIKALCGTIGISGVGIDDPDIWRVESKLPESVWSLAQIGGRTGRHDMENYKLDDCNLLINVEKICFLYQRNHDEEQKKGSQNKAN